MTDRSSPDARQGLEGIGPLICVELAWVEVAGRAEGGVRAVPEGGVRGAADAAESRGPSAQVRLRRLELPRGATLGDALVRLADPSLATALAAGTLVPAIFGERVAVSYVLHEGDRIELLGTLIADPKTSRGRRAEVQRARLGDSRWTRR